VCLSELARTMSRVNTGNGLDFDFCDEANGLGYSNRFVMLKEHIQI
jgi:hypothetical protein